MALACKLRCKHGVLCQARGLESGIRKVGLYHNTPPHRNFMRDIVRWIRRLIATASPSPSLLRVWEHFVTSYDIQVTINIASCSEPSMFTILMEALTSNKDLIRFWKIEAMDGRDFDKYLFGARTVIHLASSYPCSSLRECTYELGFAVPSEHCNDRR